MQWYLTFLWVIYIASPLAVGPSWSLLWLTLEVLKYLMVPPLMVRQKCSLMRLLDLPDFKPPFRSPLSEGVCNLSGVSHLLDVASQPLSSQSSKEFVTSSHKSDDINDNEDKC